MKTNEPIPLRTSELPQHVGSRAMLRGWLHAVRDFGNFSFLILRDGFGTAQMVVPKSLRSRLKEASSESLIEVSGTVVKNAAAPGGVELQAAELIVTLPVTEALPVTLGKKELAANLATLLDFAPLTLRHPKRRAVFRLAAAAMSGFRATLTEHVFTEIQTPKLVEAATEGGANVFGVDYFGRQAYLAQSPQFYKQMMVGVFERVFEVGPVFRAEPHATSRHVNEYVSLDVEMGFIDSHTDVMEMLTVVLRGMLEALRRRPAQLELLGVELPELSAEVVSISFERAKNVAGSDCASPDLSPAEERAIGEWAFREHGSDFVFVTGYPLSKRPFYTHPGTDNPAASNSFDLLFRGTELVTGGQRLHRYADYLEALAACGMAVEPFEGYLQAFRYGMPPHGGFAIGLERFLMQLVGAENLREVTLFPRDINRLSP